MDVTSDDELGILFEKFKKLADRKTEIFDEDIQSLVSGKNTHSEYYRLDSLSQESKTGEKPTAKSSFFEIMRGLLVLERVMGP